METVRIERFTSRVEADMAAAMLRARGFNARVTADDVAGIHPDIPFGIGGTAVEVPREEYDDAVALLDEEFVGQFDIDLDEDGSERGAEQPSRDQEAPARRADHREAARTTGRRPGLRIFAVFAAVAMLAVFVAEVGGQFGWW